MKRRHSRRTLFVFARYLVGSRTIHARPRSGNDQSRFVGTRLAHHRRIGNCSLRISACKSQLVRISSSTISKNIGLCRGRDDDGRPTGFSKCLTIRSCAFIELALILIEYHYAQTRRKHVHSRANERVTFARRATIVILRFCRRKRKRSRRLLEVRKGASRAKGVSERREKIVENSR